MTKSVWFWILLFFKLNYTLPLDLSTYNNLLDNRDTKQTQSLYTKNKYKPKTQVSEEKVINLKKVTQEIKDAVFRLEKLRSKENVQPSHKTQRSAPKDVQKTCVKRDDSKKSFNLQDVMQYERLVLSKKNPYAELDDMKLNSVLIAQKKDQDFSKYRPNLPVTGDQGIRESLEDGLNIEIVSRGLTGFEIPLKYDTQPQPQPPSPPPKEKHKSKLKRKQKVCDESFVDRLKELIYEFESKNKRNEISSYATTTKK